MTRKSAVLEPFTVDHFVVWARELELDNGDPWEVEDYFAAYVEDYFAGFSVAWLLVPEGNAKTTSEAGLMVYLLEHRRSAWIPWAASSRDQAEIGFRQAEGFILRSPRLRKFLKPQEGYRRIKNLETGGRMQVFAADASTGDGVIPTDAFIDELHRHKSLSLYRTWAGKLAKRGGQMGVISTAGEPGSEFEVAREKIKQEATNVLEEGAFGRYATERVVLHEYAVREERILSMEAVKAANPASFITEEYLAKKLADPTMTERHWRRFTCNLATMDDGREPFIDQQDWDGLADPDAVIPARAMVCLGADGSRTWDTTVVATAHVDADEVVTVEARVFSVRDDIDCHVKHQGGRIDFGDVEAFVLDRFDAYRVAGAAYDPRYLERSMEIVQSRLPAASVHPVEPASKTMRDALQTMFNLAAEGRLRHKGDDVIRQHVLNAGVERGYGSEIRRVRRVDQRKPIDAVPAMALAVWSVAQAPATSGPIVDFSRFAKVA